MTAPAGVLPAQDSRTQPHVGTVVLQRLPEGYCSGCLQRSDAPSGCSHLRWHQLTHPPHLNTGWHGSASVTTNLYLSCVSQPELTSCSASLCRWSTRLAVEAGCCPSATWTNWTAHWSPSSTEGVPAYPRRPWTWSSFSTSHTPSNTRAVRQNLQKKKGSRKRRCCWWYANLPSKAGVVDLCVVWTVKNLLFDRNFCAHQSCFNSCVTLNNETTASPESVFFCSAFRTLRRSTSVNVSPQTLKRSVVLLDVLTIFYYYYWLTMIWSHCSTLEETHMSRC